jgi:hypothetical protein
MYFDPVTLKENIAMEERLIKTNRRDALDRWVGELGLEDAIKAVKEAWARIQ